VATWEARWAELVGWCQGRRMTSCLNKGLTMATGAAVDVCPGGGALGSGQGR